MANPRTGSSRRSAGGQADPDFTNLPFWYCGTWRVGMDLAVPDHGQRTPASPSGDENHSGRAVAAAITRWGHAPEHPTCSHLGLLVLPALAIELTAAGTESATESRIGGVIPGIGSRSPRNPWRLPMCGRQMPVTLDRAAQRCRADQP